MGVQLRLAEEQGGVRLTSSQVSQEANLGQTVTFALRLERSSLDARDFELRVLNLPKEVSYSFVDLDSEARLSRISMGAGTSEVRLGLRLFLPERPTEAIAVDHALEFWPVALANADVNAFAADRHFQPEEVGALGAGAARFEVIPRGVGEISVSAPTLFSEIRGEQPLTARLTLRNSGSRRLENVRVQVEYPLNWEVDVVPAVIPALDVGREEPVDLTITPKRAVAVGDYEVRIKTESFAYNRPVQAEEKIYRVSVKSKARVLGTLGLLGGLLAVVLGVVVVGVKVTRR
jgi:uncharacterized membrane protein